MYPLKAKSEVFMCFKQFVLMVENVSSCTVGTLRSDRGGEYMSKDFDAFLAGRGINISLQCHIHHNKMVFQRGKTDP